MPSPFPGMDPYLENPATWPNLHSRLIVAIANLLGPQLRPKYRVVVEEAVYKNNDANGTVLVGVPDVAVRKTRSAARPEAAAVALANPAPVTVTLPMPATVRQRYLEIRSIQTSEVVTVVEILSPVNKRPGSGRQKYESKRLEILGSATNLVEIDLLHQHEAMPILRGDQPSDYRIVVSPSEIRPNADLYAFSLPDRLPTFLLPLQREDGAIAIDLQSLLNETYDLSGYDLDVDYGKDPEPSWPQAQRQWIDQHLKQQKLR